MTMETLEQANKLADDIDSLEMLTSQSAGCLTITYGGTTKSFYGSTKGDIIAGLCKLRDIRKERLEKL